MASTERDSAVATRAQTPKGPLGKPSERVQRRVSLIYKRSLHVRAHSSRLLACEMAGSVDRGYVSLPDLKILRSPQIKAIGKSIRNLNLPSPVFFLAHLYNFLYTVRQTRYRKSSESLMHTLVAHRIRSVI